MAFEFSFAWGEPLPPCVEVAVAVLPSLSSPLLVTVGFAQAETDRQIAPADTAESRSFLYIWIASNLELRSGLDLSPHTAGVPRFPIAGRRPPTRHAPRDAGWCRDDGRYAHSVPDDAVSRQVWEVREINRVSDA